LQIKNDGPALSRYWQAEMLGIDMAALEAEREIKPGPVAKMSGSWSAYFDRLSYERNLDIARAARRVKLNPPT